MQTILNWHFSRNDLADHYINSFEIGLMSSKVIFAPRKKGKTEFLLEDLLPLAEKRGYRVVYSSMWENRSDPGAALNEALIEAAKPRKLAQKLGKALSRVSGSMEFAVPTLGNLKVSTNTPKSAEQDQVLLALPVLMDAVIKASKGKVLLALDEVWIHEKKKSNRFSLVRPEIACKRCFLRSKLRCFSLARPAISLIWETSLSISCRRGFMTQQDEKYR